MVTNCSRLEAGRSWTYGQARRHRPRVFLGKIRLWLRRTFWKEKRSSEKTSLISKLVPVFGSFHRTTRSHVISHLLFLTYMAPSNRLAIRPRRTRVSWPDQYFRIRICQRSRSNRTRRQYKFRMFYNKKSIDCWTQKNLESTYLLQNSSLPSESSKRPSNHWRTSTQSVPLPLFAHLDQCWQPPPDEYTNSRGSEKNVICKSIWKTFRATGICDADTKKTKGRIKNKNWHTKADFLELSSRASRKNVPTASTGIGVISCHPSTCMTIWCDKNGSTVSV